MADINLLPLEEKATEHAQSTARRLQFTSIAFLVGTAIITIATLIMYASLSSARGGLVNRVEGSSAQINNLKAQEELIVVVKDKAQAAQKLSGSRVDYADFFRNLSGLLPQNVYFTDIRVSSGKIVVSGKAKGSSDVSALSSSLLSAKGSQLVNSVNVDSLSSDETGNYVFVISASLSGPGGPSPSPVVQTQSGGSK